MKSETKRAGPNHPEIPGRWVRLKASNFWQAAFVRPYPPGKDKWKTRFATLLSYVVGIFLLIPLMSASLIDDYMTAPIPLGAMHKTTGVLVNITDCYRCPQLFEVKLDSGDHLEFGASMDSLIKLKPYIGSEVTVWYQQGFHIATIKEPHFFIDQVYEIKIKKNGEMLNQYQIRRGEWIARDNKDHWWFLAFLLLGLWLPFRIVWKHRKAG